MLLFAINETQVKGAAEFAMYLPDSTHVDIHLVVRMRWQHAVAIRPGQQYSEVSASKAR